MFEDDTNLFFIDSDLSYLINVANHDLDNKILWFKLNKLSHILKKSKKIHIIQNV